MQKRSLHDRLMLQVQALAIHGAISLHGCAYCILYLIRLKEASPSSDICHAARLEKNEGQSVPAVQSAQFLWLCEGKAPVLAKDSREEKAAQAAHV